MQETGASFDEHSRNAQLQIHHDLGPFKILTYQCQFSPFLGVEKVDSGGF